ncbi:MAG: tRNA (adenosine(37)-N6)-dimethylallyltransferase MiaA [Clostridia bacterium]
MNKKVIVIVGPTASGKTGLSIECAKRLNGEIISCDSMQIFKEQNIGTAKVTNAEMQGIVHHQISIISSFDEYSVQEFATNTKKKIDEIFASGKTPILVGGTGLFVESLIEEYDFAQTPKNIQFRAELESQCEKFGTEFLYQKLCQENPARAQQISSNDKKRIIRSLEICNSLLNKETTSDVKTKSTNKYLIFGIKTQRDALYERINKRVDDMIQKGLINEVKTLYDKGLNENYQSMKGIGYKEFFPFFKNEITKEEAIEKVKQHSRNYAKRQITWFNHMKEINWIKASEIEKIITTFKEETK